jgi:methionyl-tRNA formyltransferase
MKIVFFTQEDPFYVKVFFEEFFKQYRLLHEIKAIVISRPMGKKSVWKLATQMYNFYGFSDFIRMGLKYVYIKIMGKRSIKALESEPPKTYTLRQLANLYGLEVIERSDLNSPDFITLIRRHDADLFISVASPVIFKKELISMPRLDCINIHNAPLPRYRGMLPNFWQLYHGEKESGITIHRIDTGIDTGDIVSQLFVPIGADESLHDLIVRTKKEGARLMSMVIDSYRQGRIQYKKMEGEGSYFSFPTREDVHAFKKKGHRLL